MRTDLSLLTKDGHSRAIEHKGPFVIGRDFKAPSPSGLILPNIKLPPATLKKLQTCITRAKAHNEVTTRGIDELSDDKLFDDVTSEGELENGVRRALSWYVSNRQFQPDEKKIRREIKALRDRIRRFKSQLPDEHDALGKFIKDTYTGEAFSRDDLRPSDSDRIAFQNAWHEQIGLSVASDNLDVMRRYVEAAEKCLGKKKPRNHRVQILVQSLAQVWRAQVGAWPKSGRHPSTSKQIGPFAEFVRVANDVLPQPFRVQSLDAAIRHICSRSGF